MGGETGAPAIPGCRSLSLLGERSASTVYAADSDRYGGAVTVTIYSKPGDEGARLAFEAAVRTAQRLGAHPNLVTVHASGYTGDGRPYVVSDGHERTTAEGVLATSGVLGVEQVLRIGIALAGALETAHRAGVVHGGVAPGLILLRSDGQPVLTEVGLAHVGQPVGASAALARWIPYHAPPEVLEGTTMSPATDIYSLASVVYTLLVGRPPHATAGVDDSTASLLLRILQMPMPAIERSDVAPQLEDALRTALAHSPDKRPQHALELAWALQEAQRIAGMEVTDPVVLDLAPEAGRGDPPGPAGPAAPAGAAAPPEGPDAAGGAGPAGPPEARPDWSWLAAVAPATPGVYDPARSNGHAGGYRFPGDPGDAAGGGPGAEVIPGPGFAASNGSARPAAGGVAPGAPELSTPWWATGGPGGAGTAGQRPGFLPPTPAPAEPEVDLGPVHRPPIDPTAERALHQPLPPDQRPPIDTNRLAAAFGDAPSGPPARLPALPASTGSPPAVPPGGEAAVVPRARQTPVVEPDVPAEPPTRPGTALVRSERPTAEAIPRSDRAGDARHSDVGGGLGTRRPSVGTLSTPPNDRALSALERARQARLERQRRERDGDDPAAAGQRERAGSPSRSSAPALPVIVLIVLVVVLGLGGAWLILTGEDASEPASDASADDTAPSSTAAGPSTTQAGLAGNRASDITAVETAEGVQLDWEGPVGISYLVRVLSTTESPVPLAAGPATATLVPNTLLDSSAPYCFDVVAAPEPGVTFSIPDDPNAVVLPTVCIRGATPQSVVRQ